MILNTKHFGELEIDESKILLFEEGILGFPEHKTYVLITDEEDPNSPFCWLQSVTDSELAFVLVNPFSFYPEYSPEVSDEELAVLGEAKDEELTLYNIVVVPEDITKMTANLKAPLIININTQKALQIVVNNEEYEIKHQIYDEIQKRISEEAGDQNASTEPQER
jgi:flagellar assembly factor FliW